MQWLWCWRCKGEMPMLDEAEFAEVMALYGESFRATKEFREKWGLPLGSLGIEERLIPVLRRYQEITGYEETNPNAVMHHRLAMYGPPCGRCGKPLRTAKAKLCGSCMWPVSQ